MKTNFVDSHTSPHKKTPTTSAKSYPSNNNPSSPSNTNKRNKSPGTLNKRNNKSPHTSPNKSSNKGLYTPTESSHLLCTPENCKTPSHSQINNKRTPRKNTFTYPPPLSSSSTMNPANLPSSMQSLNHLPPLMNLTKRTLINWNEIEAKNLESILESTKPVEVYVCDTTIRDIYQSFKDNRLDISQRNMENIVSSGGSRSKRFFILRVNTAESGRFIVGVVSINQSGGVMKSHRRTDRYLVGVCYLAVSCPLLSELTAHNHYDGMEVYPNVYNRLLQQYKFQLNGKKTCCVRPLFPKVFVSSIIPLSNIFAIVFCFSILSGGSHYIFLFRETV